MAVEFGTIFKFVFKKHSYHIVMDKINPIMHSTASWNVWILSVRVSFGDELRGGS